MAIAPIPEQQEFDLLEVPWPKPSLRVVTDPWDRPSRPFEASTVPTAIVEHPPLREGLDISQRRALRTSRRVRRNRALLGLAVAAAVVVLCLPLRATGAVTVMGQPTPGGVPAGLSDGTPYVVQGGDTLDSIARKMAPAGDTAQIVAKLRQVVGSSVVVPGERIILP